MQAPPQQSPGSGDAILRFLEWLASAIGGALLILVGFRTKLALMDKEIKDNKVDSDRALETRLSSLARDIDRGDANVARLLNDHVAHAQRVEENIYKRIERFEKRQLMGLRLQADIARKLQVDLRLTDAFLTLLDDEAAEVDAG